MQILGEVRLVIPLLSSSISLLSELALVGDHPAYSSQCQHLLDAPLRPRCGEVGVLMQEV